ncbi:MAG: hypothetical protein COT73_05195 [Bdellovibrio sp. CG10_big_fil_rev_8_21_14_0_10_47_8]|nr:MAG: hypothetical protein COT73_05195 [Bdellovibrio sp. CG10_big_fil_rev_8_21_14_0_10_47_8]
MRKDHRHSTFQRPHPTPKRLRTTIRFDGINPADFSTYDFRFACEDCSHFDAEGSRCTLGYDPQWHRKSFQQKSYELSGRMALCRFLEID